MYTQARTACCSDLTVLKHPDSGIEFMRLMSHLSTNSDRTGAIFSSQHVAPLVVFGLVIKNPRGCTDGFVCTEFCWFLAICLCDESKSP